MSKSLNEEDMNPNIIKLEYAVRGPIMIRAAELEKELASGAQMPFPMIIRANLGDCHAMNQVPITFIRQLLALCLNPKLMIGCQFNSDVKERARMILGATKGNSIGAYTSAPGIIIIRKHVANYIKQRDGGIPSDWNNIVLSTGATDGIKNVLKLFMKTLCEKPPGCLIPIPQYPLYSATLAEFAIEQIGYYLDEDNDWEVTTEELNRCYEEAVNKGINPRIIVVINPGNPTGQVLTRSNIEKIIKFAYERRLFILADEVYQFNIWAADSEFFSFKKVMHEMGPPYSDMELVSFMSVSKGYMGECGLRGGYAECVNMDADVKEMYFKQLDSMLCSPTPGQIAMECVVNPPVPGDESYDLYNKERTDILNSLKMRAKMVEEAFANMKGFHCNEVKGAIYAFPRIDLPDRAIEAAKEKDQAPDVFYAFNLLEETGICIVPGSGFGQKPGTYHIRTTILAQPELLQTMFDKFADFHKKFVEKYENEELNEINEISEINEK